MKPKEDTTPAKPARIIDKPPVIDSKPIEIGKISTPDTALMDDTTTSGKPLAFNRKRREYKAFIKLIRAGKYVSARLSAEALGVNYTTIASWLHTPAVIKALQAEVDDFVDNMRQSGKTDWRMWDKMIDRAIGSNPEQQSAPKSQVLIINNGDDFKLISRKQE